MVEPISDLRPNIIMVMTDQHAARIMGCAGDESAITPALDAFAAQATRFENCYCSSPLCVPSRMAFLTGLEPHQSGVLNNDTYLASDIPTIAHALGAKGYDCHLVGRMHFNGPDQTHGFAKRPIGDIGASYPGGNPPDIGPLTKGRGNKGPELEFSGCGETSYQAYDHAVVEQALVTLAELKTAHASSGKPFFLLISLFCPHPPYIARRSDFEPFDGKLPPPELPTPETDHPAIATWRKVGGTASVSQSAISNSRTAYYGLVSMIDRLFGQIEAIISADDNTLTIYASDHGECLGERGLWWKSVMFDESAKVPMIIRGPGFEANRTDTRVTSLMDLSATILALAGTSLTEHTGTDLRSSDTWSNTIYSEYYGGLMNIKLADVRHRMIRRGPHKLIYYDGFDPQLFDLEHDPKELNDLVNDPAYSGVSADLTHLILQNWDPSEIARKQITNAERMRTIKIWVRESRPPEPMRWTDPRPERNAYE